RASSARFRSRWNRGGAHRRRPPEIRKHGRHEEERMDRLECDRMFVAVLEAGSFAKAAARLGTSAGQASKLVSRLEANLGVRLLSRTTRSLSATEIGRAYYERIQPLLAELDAIDVVVKNASGAASGRIRLSAP